MPRAGLLGGSFNPVHVAHLVVAEMAREQHGLDTVYFIPAARSPYKPDEPMAEDEHRLQMVRLAIDGNPSFRASDVEIRRGGLSYTLTTVREFKERMPEWEFLLLVGGDSLKGMGGWWHADELVGEVDVAAFDRPGAQLPAVLREPRKRLGEQWAQRTLDLKVDAPLMEVSATDIRRRLREGRSIRYLVPESVRAYIAAHGLYQGPSKSSSS